MNVFCPSITHSCAGVVERGARPSRARVGARLGFGEPERAEHLARDHRHEVLLLLRLGAGVEERRGAEAHARLERDRHRRVDAGELLDREAVREVVGAATAVLLGERQAEQAELAHREHRVDREHVVAVPRFGVRRDLRLRELAHDASELLLFGREVELHRPNRTPAVASALMAPVTGAAVLAQLPLGRGPRSCATATPRSSRSNRPRFGVRRARTRSRASTKPRATASGSDTSPTTSAATSSACARASPTISASPTSCSPATTRAWCSSRARNRASWATARPPRCSRRPRGARVASTRPRSAG